MLISPHHLLLRWVRGYTMDNSAYLKALKKKQEAQQRAMKRQIKKQECPVHQEKVRAKKIVSQNKMIAKQKLKQSAAPSEEQLLKARVSLRKSQEKQRNKALLQRTLPSAQVRSLKASKPKASKIKIKSNEKSRNKGDMSLHDLMGGLGCIACRNQGLGLVDMDSSITNYVSIHHVDGRVKTHCHKLCLPLCQWHHDTPLSVDESKKWPMVFPIHAKGSVGGKTSWEKINGKQSELIKQVWKLVGYTPTDEITEQLNKI